MTRKLILLLLPLALCLLGTSAKTAFAAPTTAEGWKIEPYITGLNQLTSVTFDDDGHLYYGLRNGELFTVEDSGFHRLLATFGSEPFISYRSEDDRVYVAPIDDRKIWKVSFSGEKTLFVQSAPDSITTVAFDDSGFGYVVEFRTGALTRLSPDGTATRLRTAIATGPSGVSYGPDKLLYIGSREADEIVRINPTTLARDVFVGLDGPELVAWLSDGSLVVNGLWSGQLTWFSANGSESRVLVDGLLQPRGPAIGPDGAIYIPTRLNGTIWRLSRIAPANAVVTHNGSGADKVGVTVLEEGDTRVWQFGVIGANSHFIPRHRIRTAPADGGAYRLGFRSVHRPREIISLDDPRVTLETAGEQPDGNYMTLIFTLDGNDDGTPDLRAVLQVKNLRDSLQTIHIDDAP